ncbi:hypothetical protein KJ707_00545 [Patescibacteria group bacterium]|nr:hypothetical protein [Patescibacteria group bacterium]MBU1967138.1 hypothetical protein [Patescibacteria group bacterium]MBU2543044.1 hypothetical protein [Patescibacteria group bacterium]
MQTQTTQIRVTLPVQLRGYLQTKANKFGLGLSAYIKNLIINDVQDVDYPVFEMSDQAISDFEEAKKAEHAGSLVKIDNVSNFFKNL